MTKWAYLVHCCHSSLHGPSSIAQTISLFVTIVGGILAVFNPGWAGWLNVLLWLVPLIVFLVLFAHSWAMSPYRMLKEIDDKRIAPYPKSSRCNGS
jgi:fatty acid desaturase